MGIKGLKISMIVSISFDTEAMPRLNPQQREQAICRLHVCGYATTPQTARMTDHVAVDHRLQPLARTG